MKCGGVAPRIGAHQGHGARVGLQETEQDPQRGCLARPIRSKEPVNSAFVDVKGQPVKCADGTKGLDDIVEVDHARSIAVLTASEPI